MDVCPCHLAYRTAGPSINITQDPAQQRDVVQRYCKSQMGYVDLHSHVLFGLDDGAPAREASLAMLDALATLGVSEQCVTPHQKASQYLPAWDAIEATYSTLDGIRKPGHPTLRLAAENMWDDVFLGRIGSDAIPMYRGT